MRPLAPALALLLLAALVPPATHAAADPTCGTGAPVTATHGGGDAALPSLAYAALKTGFRVVVAWETPEPVVASLRWSLDGGATTTLSESSARTTHVFVVSDLPVQRAFCFTPLGPGGVALTETKGLRTANAMRAYEDGAYTVNLLVLANERSRISGVEAGLESSARLVHDMTDGHVRLGRVLVVVGDYEKHNSGFFTCFLVSVRSPACNHLYDVLFTHDASPQGAASTFIDGIQNSRATIWMNSYHQAGAVNTGDDVGLVLTHELGHYAFGLEDLYIGGDCYDAAKGLSVMGSSRRANELDDDANRCPNESALGPGRVASWDRLRARYPQVPSRNAIDPGPTDVGERYSQHTFSLLPRLPAGVPSVGVPPAPQLPNVGEVLQEDDAGSGRDASAFTAFATPIVPGVLHRGTLLAPLDGGDAYVFDATAGAKVEVRAYPRTSCPEVSIAGAPAPGTCEADAEGAVHRFVAAKDGPIHLRFALGDGPVYWFGVGVDTPAPALVGQAEPR